MAPRTFSDLTEQRFGLLVANVYDARARAWRCTCDCGQEVLVPAKWLRQGQKKSCALNGHRFRPAQQRGGGARQYEAEYRAWYDAKRRCNDKKYFKYQDYGKRGIKICARWKTFTNFLSDMGPRPSKEHSLDRYPNNDGNYEPGNCRWATRPEQQRNMRSSVYVDYEGQRMLLLDVLAKLGLSANVVRGRLRMGWSLAESLMIPVRPRKKNRRKD